MLEYTLRTGAPQKGSLVAYAVWSCKEHIAAAQSSYIQGRCNNHTIPTLAVKPRQGLARIHTLEPEEII